MTPGQALQLNKYIDSDQLFNAVTYSPAEEAKECPYVKEALVLAWEILDHNSPKHDYDFFDFVLYILHPDYFEYLPMHRASVINNLNDTLYLYKAAFCFATLPAIGEKLTEFLCKKLWQEAIEIKETNLD